MPSFVPAHREVIYASGVLELACAAGLLHPRTRSLAGWASFALLLGVYPANLKMAGDAAAQRPAAAPRGGVRPAPAAAADAVVGVQGGPRSLTPDIGVRPVRGRG